MLFYIQFTCGVQTQAISEVARTERMCMHVSGCISINSEFEKDNIIWNSLAARIMRTYVTSVLPQIKFKALRLLVTESIYIYLPHDFMQTSLSDLSVVMVSL